MSSIGPQIPAHLLGASVSNPQQSDDEDDYTPALPPDLAAARKVAGPSLPPPPPPSGGPSAQRPRSRSPAGAAPAPRRVVGPTLPSTRPSYDFDSSSDSDDVGPQPIPATNTPAEEKSGVQQFLEREERRRQAIEEAKQPKKLVREEWMLVPPKSGDLLSSLDPTKLKARQFGRGSTSARDSDSSLWTETPAERQQRLADEVSGRKRRAVNAEPPEEDPDALRKRRRRDAEIRKGVEEHTRKARGAALVQTHLERERQEKDRDKSPPVIWDHSRDMSLSGRLMDDSQRQKMLRDAKGLGDRFGTGKSGGFL